MILFRIIYINNGDATEKEALKEQSFFDQVQDASRIAKNQTPIGMSPQEWLDNAYLSARGFEAEKILKRKVSTPSIIVQYRADDRSSFKNAYLKGVGNTAAWTKKFVEIFNLVPIEKREEAASSASDATDTEGGKEGGKDNGKADGKEGGNGNGWGLGTRDCNFLDDLLSDMGIETALKKVVYGGAAIFLGSRALQSGNRAGQAVQGGAAAFLAYLALTATPGCGKKSK